MYPHGHALCIPTDTLSALYADHLDLPVVCTNIAGAQGPRSIEVVEVFKRRIAIIGLISKSYQTEISTYNPSITLMEPAKALETLAETIAGKSDVVVGVFHGTEAEARTLAEGFSWLSVLICAQSEPSEVASDIPIIVGNTTIVANPAKGEDVYRTAVGGVRFYVLGNDFNATGRRSTAASDTCEVGDRSAVVWT